MWVAANARIMHKLSNTGKLSGPSQIADYVSYTVKVAELLKPHTLASVIIYDNEYCKLSTRMDFAGAAIHSILIRGFLLNVAHWLNLTKLWLGLLLTHAPILAANHNLSNQSAANLTLCRAVFGLNAAFNMSASWLIVLSPTLNTSTLPRCPINAHDLEPAHVYTYLC